MDVPVLETEPAYQMIIFVLRTIYVLWWRAAGPLKIATDHLPALREASVVHCVLSETHLGPLIRPVNADCAPFNMEFQFFQAFPTDTT